MVNQHSVVEGDLDACFTIESTCYTTDAATREKIKKRIALFPDGFLYAGKSKSTLGGFEWHEMYLPLVFDNGE